MDIVTIGAEQAGREMVEELKQALKKEGIPFREDPVSLALSGDHPAGMAAMQQDAAAPHRASVLLSVLRDEDPEVADALLADIEERAGGEEVTLLLCPVFSGDRTMQETLLKRNWSEVGEIPGYFDTDGTLQDAELFCLDLRQDEDEGRNETREYVTSMIRDGYDDTNIAWFCRVDEDYVKAVRRELGIPEPE